MNDPRAYRPSYWQTQPEYLYPPYRSTVKRAPTKPLVMPPQTISEITGPLFGHDDVSPEEGDLTAQHADEPLGERIIASGRVLDENGRPMRGASLLAEVLLDLLGQVVRHDNDVLDVRRQRGQYPIQDRPAADRQQRFRRRQRVWAQPGAEPRCQNDGIHRVRIGKLRRMCGLYGLCPE